MHAQPQQIAVLGAGSWGTALAFLLARNQHAVTLWGRDASALQQMAHDRCNQRYLPQITFPDNLELATDLASACRSAELVLIAVPSHGFANLMTEIAGWLPETCPVLWASKGLDPEHHQLLSDVAERLLGTTRPLGIISGPSFAGEVAAGLPTAVTVAANQMAFAKAMSELFSNDSFRVYTSTDLIGVQVGGAVKNVVAIAAGISDGLGFGANARCGLITRSLAEMVRLGVALGAREKTFMGLAGLGDLILTCTDNQSRNRRFGLALGRGIPRSAAEQQIGQVVEGIKTCDQVYTLAQKLSVTMPVTEQVYRVLTDQTTPAVAVKDLLTRPLKSEL